MTSYPEGFSYPMSFSSITSGKIRTIPNCNIHKMKVLGIFGIGFFISIFGIKQFTPRFIFKDHIPFRLIPFGKFTRPDKKDFSLSPEAEMRFDLNECCLIWTDSKIDHGHL